MKKILLVLMFFFSTYAFADINTYKLTDEQAAQLQLQAAQMKKANENGSAGILPATTSSTFDAAKQWADIGRGVAIGVGAGAKELGVAVNEFAVTPVGRLTTAIIVWKIMGKDVLHLLISFILLGIMLPSVWIIRGRLTIERIDYETYTGFLGMSRRRVKTIIRNTDDAATWWNVVAVGSSAIFIIISLINLVG